MRVIVAIKDFLALESAGGILLAVAALAAMALANSPLEGVYVGFLDTPVEVRIGQFEIAKNLLPWINDGLMAVFFFFVGLKVFLLTLAILDDVGAIVNIALFHTDNLLPGSLGIAAGALVAALAGYAVLRAALPMPR